MSYTLNMSEPIDKKDWPTFLTDFTKRNHGRPTRLGVFEKADGAANDYWLEDGLPLTALDAYADHGSPCVDVLLNQFRHSVRNVVGLVKHGSEEQENGLDILDAAGNVTIMRFENWPVNDED
jgi:hypothetical protein